MLGRKAFREDQEARLKRRQAEAKALVRRQLDDVTFQVGKQLKDRLRLVQRSIRDHFTEIADEHHRSLTDSVAAAQQAATTYALEKDARIREIKAELKKVDAVSRAAAAVAAEVSAATPRQAGGGQDTARPSAGRPAGASTVAAVG